jgi:Pyridine nucleotide-disulphide oxidoreductase
MHDTLIVLPLLRCMRYRRCKYHVASLAELRVASRRDGGVIIDEQMQTSVPGVFAAGDVCCAKALEQASAHWFQMRLWTQVSCQSSARTLLFLHVF